MARLEELEKQLKEMEKEIKKLKEQKEDKNLEYLNNSDISGIKGYWFVNSTLEKDTEYIAIDSLNDKYQYVVKGFDGYSHWWFKIQKLDDDNYPITITGISISKQELPFKKFVNFIVKPIVQNIEFEEEE